MSDGPSRAPDSGVDWVLPLTRRGRRWLLAGAALGMVVGATLYVLTPPQHRAEAVVELSEVSSAIEVGAGNGGASRVTIDTDAQLLAADEVIAAIATESGRPADDVRESLSVTARPLTRILEITYSDRSASSAQAGAQRAAEGFLAARDRIVIQPVREYLSEVAKENQQLEETRNVLEETNSTIDGTRLVEWQERAVLAELEVPGPGSVVEQSHITSTGDRGDVEVPVVTGLCFGGLLGLVAGQLRDRQYGRRTSSGAVRNDRQSQSGALPGDSGNAPDAGPERGQRSRRRRRLSRLGIILICAVGGLLGGLVLAGSLRTPAVGEATILLRPLPGNAFAGRGGNTTVDLHTETSIPRSDEVLQRVSQADGNRVRPEELRPRLKVRVIEPTEVLALSFRAPNAARAKALAEDVARATLAVRRERAVAEYARQSAILDPLIVAAEADLANVSAQPDNTDEVLALSDKLVTLRDQLNPVDERPNPGEVLETSVAKDQDVPRLQAGIVGLGLLGGAGVGWLLSRRWPRGPSAGPSSMRRRFRPATRTARAGLGSLRTSQRRLAG